MKILYTHPTSDLTDTRFYYTHFVCFFILKLMIRCSFIFIIYFSFCRNGVLIFNTPRFWIQGKKLSLLDTQVITTTLSCLSWQKKECKAISNVDFQVIPLNVLLICTFFFYEFCRICKIFQSNNKNFRVLNCQQWDLLPQETLYHLQKVWDSAAKISSDAFSL